MHGKILKRTEFTFYYVFQCNLYCVTAVRFVRHFIAIQNSDVHKNYVISYLEKIKSNFINNNKVLLEQKEENLYLLQSKWTKQNGEKVHQNVFWIRLSARLYRVAGRMTFLQKTHVRLSNVFTQFIIRDASKLVIVLLLSQGSWEFVWDLSLKEVEPFRTAWVGREFDR